MSSELVKPLGLEAWMVECLSTLRRIADEVAGLRAEARSQAGPPLDPAGTQLLTVAETAKILGIGRLGGIRVFSAFATAPLWRPIGRLSHMRLLTCSELISNGRQRLLSLRTLLTGRS